MSEGLLGGILGGEEPKADVEKPEALAPPEAFAAALAARLAAIDPGVANDTSAFLRDQSEVLKVQKRQLEEEREARLHYLRGQAREVDIRRFGLRLRVDFQEAHRRGPRGADPLKAWGDVLAKQGRIAESIKKYDEALKYAPAWSALEDAREAAAKLAAR